MCSSPPPHLAWAKKPTSCDSDVDWADEEFGGSLKRERRDDWVGQARILADGGDTNFSKKVDIAVRARRGIGWIGLDAVIRCGKPQGPVWMAPALQEFSVIATVCQYSRVSGLFAWRLPLALMSSASKVPIG